jgi:hypothetical protein
MRKISKSRMRRYRVMRLLFGCDNRDFDELMREGQMSKIELINVIGYLKRSRLIEKKTNKNETFYMLTERGEVRLAFYEFTFKLYEQWRPKWCEGEENDWQNRYYEEVSELIRKSNYFGYENYF